jgi:DNA-directed RNA polymerase alpha subunit
LLYYVWVTENAGKIEHAALRRLRRYQVLTTYEKDGNWQRGREIVQCDFSIALDALTECLGGHGTASAFKSMRSYLFDFDRMDELQREAEREVAAREAEAAKTAFDFAFLTKIDELPLSIRSGNCLRNEKIVYVGDLVQRTEAEMLRTPNFGRKSLDEIKEALAALGLYFGMELRDWPPADAEESRKLLGTSFVIKAGDLQLSMRSSNILKEQRIAHVGDLVQRTEAEMLRAPNVGRKSLDEINEMLAGLGLHFGMEIPARPIKRSSGETPG